MLEKSTGAGDRRGRRVSVWAAFSGAMGTWTMWQRLLIVDPGERVSDLLDTATRAEVEPVLLFVGNPPAAVLDAPVLVEKGLDENTITKRARDEGVRGIYAASREAWPAVAASAARLGFPALAPGKSEGLLVSHAQRLRAHHVDCIDSRLVNDAAMAEEAAGELGLPLRVRTAGWADPPRCMLVKHLADLPLALAKVRKHSASKRVMVQRHVQGAIFRILGYKTRKTYLPLAAVREVCTEDAFCVPMLRWAPHAGEIDREEWLQWARRAGAALPDGTGFLEFECVRCEQGILLGGIQVATGPAPIDRRLVAHVSGTDLLEQGLRLAAGLPSRPVRPPHRAAAICWIPSRSGMVDRVKGVDRARQYPGVRHVEIAVRAGDTLGHVVDQASRDRIGYVMADGTAPREAIDAARNAAGLIEVVTRTTL